MSSLDQASLAWTEAPSDGWSCPRVKSLFRDDAANITVKQLSECDVDHYSIPAFDENGLPVHEHGETISSNKTLLRGGELLFSKLNSHKPRVWLVPVDEKVKVASTEFIALRQWHSGKVDLPFTQYLLGSAVLAQYISCFQTSVTNSHKRITPEDLWRLRIPMPRIEEQHRIVAFLDESCAAIDAAVAAKRRQIETLDAIRESIVETALTQGLDNRVKRVRIERDWIESVPQHWDAVNIKRLVLRVDYGISESTEQQGRHPVLKMGNIQAGEITLANMEFVDEVEEELLLDTNDLLYNRTNSLDQVGKAALFGGSKRDGVTFASYLVRLRVNHRVKPGFLNYVVNSQGFLQFARKLAIPSVQQANLNSTRYCRMLVPLPPASEQQAICDYLDAKVGEMKRIISTIQFQIQTLIAYRKSLIHECVTGQRRITEADVRRLKDNINIDVA